jgi:hypothetical protein
MRSVSDEGEDSRPSPERGPLGLGGMVETEVPHIEADQPFGGSHLEGASKPFGAAGNVGIELKPLALSERLAAEPRGAWCLKPYWGKLTVRNSWEGGWKRGDGSLD